MSADPTNKVTVATYNVLADAYVRPEYFPHCLPEHLTAAKRYPRVVERVAGLGADVICLQEVDVQLFQALRVRLTTLGYRGRWAHKDGVKPDGVATFVRAPWYCKEARVVPLAEVSDPDSSGHIALITRIRGPLKNLVVANAHLKWDEPNRSGSGHQGFVQAQVLLAALAVERDCTVACGDFNAEPSSNLLTLFHQDFFADAHRQREATCFTNGNAHKIDYVLGRGRMSGALCLTAMPVPPVSVATPTPSDLEPSDHVPVMTIVEF